MRAYILIEATVGRSREVARALGSTQGVTNRYLVTGPYDIIAMVEGDDANAIGHIVASRIHSIPGIARTVTCLAVGYQPN